jgi:hypothetical protein
VLGAAVSPTVEVAALVAVMLGAVAVEARLSAANARP